jgi:hypothetical protein
LASPLNAAIAAARGTGAELPAIATLAAFSKLSLVAALLVAVALPITLFIVRRARRATLASAVTWDCGYAAPSATMQYTSSSFAQWLVDLFAWLLHPIRKTPSLAVGTRGAPERPTTERLFPAHAAFASEVPDVVLDRAILPALQRLAVTAARAHWLQQGRVQTYLLYIMITLGVLLSRV